MNKKNIALLCLTMVSLAQGMKRKRGILPFDKMPPHLKANEYTHAILTLAEQYLQKEGKDLTNKLWRKKVLELFQEFTTNLPKFEKQKSDNRQITMDDFLAVILSGKKQKTKK